MMGWGNRGVAPPPAGSYSSTTSRPSKHVQSPGGGIPTGCVAGCGQRGMCGGSVLTEVPEVYTNTKSPPPQLAAFEPPEAGFFFSPGWRLDPLLPEGWVRKAPGCHPPDVVTLLFFCSIFSPRQHIRAFTPSSGQSVICPKVSLSSVICYLPLASRPFPTKGPGCLGF